MNFATASDSNFEDTTFTHYFTNDQFSITIPYPDGFDSSQWYVFNKQQIGYYRVNYNIANWNALIKVLNSENFEQIHVLNRAQLIDDSLNFAADNLLDYDVPLGILSYLTRETDYVPWRAAVNNLDKLESLLIDEQSQANFKRFVRHLLRRMYVTFEITEELGDLIPDKYGRELAFDWTCRMGDAACLSKAYEATKRQAFDGVKIPAPMQIVYICHGLKGDDKQDEFNALWGQMKASTDQAERLRILDGLMCSSDPDLLNSLLNDVLDSSDDLDYRKHERQRIMNNIFIRSSVGVKAMADFLSASYERFVAM